MLAVVMVKGSAGHGYISTILECTDSQREVMFFVERWDTDIPTFLLLTDSEIIVLC